MSISKPDVNVIVASANTVLDIGTRRDLIVCQTAIATANELVQNIQDKTQAELDALCGVGSYCRVMVQEWLDANLTGNNVKAELDLIVLLDGAAATAAVITTTFSGSSTAAGEMSVSVLSSKLYKKIVSVPSGTAAAAVGPLITTAFTGEVAPFVVSDGGATMIVTASDLGTIGNDYGIEIRDIPSGLSISGTVVTAGTVAPTVTNVMDLVGGIRYQGILWPTDLASSVDEVVDFLDARFNSSNSILDGVAFMGDTSTLSNAKVLANAQNSQSLTVIGNAISIAATVKIGPEIVHPVDFTVAAFMAIRARRLSDNASIGSLVVSNASNDQFGGRAMASLPYFNTPLASVPVTDSATLFNDAEQAELNDAGYSVLGPNRPITDTIMGVVVTTYKTDVAGNSDVSFKYLNYVDTASVCREFLFNNFKSLFAQSRLTDGDLIAGRSMENEASLKSAFKGLLAILKDDALVRKGATAANLIDDSLTVTLDLANRKATISSILPIVTQLETINVPLRMSFEQ